MLDIFSTYLEPLSYWFAGSALWVLFFSGFLSATLLPGSSEASLFATLSLNQFPVFWVIAVASAGNTLGGLTNYWLGIWLPNRTEREKHGHKALAWLNKYGYWALLFSWLPVVGDVLCLAAGWLRMKFLPTFVIILIGKALRYIMLAAVFYGFF
ncbi:MULTISPECIES: YqaA family protein [Vibrio]|uniref:VTT domain-containing protein n=1 Tax=Vibrio ordalii FS-238 TaxID=617133 RepID=A0A853RAF7_9VIBR|nr:MULTISPECIES: YqaA family protein [Vibrio]ASG02795.1 DedA family protein [Vibrio anguillarum]MBF4256653.1 DedA family protein [Vibrio anguillarum]MBF4298386.1 DedA family protein [Vibrio anguillarum]MBF4398560.1 DedA family protein [Vibrio anguillarum]MBF4439693.1 DedA family protein [Vibrio anguillarum]